MTVRTQNFKNWFGDWEEVSKYNQFSVIEPFAVKSNRVIGWKEAEEIYSKLTTAIVNNDKREIKFVNSIFGKIIRHKESKAIMQIIPDIKNILQGSIFAYFEAERNPEEHRNLLGFRNYVNKVTMDGAEYYVRFAAQIPRTRRGEARASENCTML